MNVEQISANAEAKARRGRPADQRRRRKIEAAWAEGLSPQEMAERFGWAGKDPGAHVNVLRFRGYDVPRRRGPGGRPRRYLAEAVASIHNRAECSHDEGATA